MPMGFVRDHPEYCKENAIFLRAKSSTIPYKVELGVYNVNSKATPEVKLGKGWRTFAVSTEIKLGDSLIFKRLTVLEFEVYVFRSTTVSIPTSTSSSPVAPKDLLSSDSELAQKSGHFESSAGCSRQLHLAAERSQGSADVVAKKRRVGKEAVVSASQSTSQNSSFTNLRPPEILVNVPVQRCQESIAANNAALPSFITRLVEYNVRDSTDSAGNICGPRFEIPLSFVKTHGVQLQAHVKLQGVRNESPSRHVTCSPTSCRRIGRPCRLDGATL